MALLSYQQEPCAHLTKLLLEKGSALDASQTGTGKTYCAVHAALRLGLPTGIICPKSVIPSWKRVCKAEGLEPEFILNYESLVRGNTMYVTREGPKLTWNFAGLLIWDEVQRCKTHTSLNSKLLAAAWDTKLLRCLCLSATAVQDPLEMRALGQVLGIHKGYNFWQWAISTGARKDKWGGFKWRGSTEQLEAIHKHLFPGRGVRVRIKDLGDLFPSNKIIAEPLEINDKGALNAVFNEAQRALDELKETAANDYPSAFTIMLRARQKAELLKVPLLVEMTQDLLNEGKSVILFVNFNDTLELLANYLNTNCVIRAQDAEERIKNLDEFQNNEQRIIICNIQAGGVGISLHDLNGNHPRAVLLCPTFNAVDLRQALGRAYRSGAKSPVIQRLVYAAGTIEERVCERVQSKLNNIDLVNDSELSELIWVTKSP